MNSSLKRPVSPPPSRRPIKSPKRQKTTGLVHPIPPAPPTSADTITIYSWNANGLLPYLRTNNRTNASTRPISSFFMSATTSSSGTIVNTSNPTLRDILRGHGYPDIFCIQEVKLTPRDDGMLRLASEAAGENYEMYHTLPEPTDPNIRNRMMYGVATYVKRSPGLEVVDERGVEWDTEGRVHILTIRRGDRYLTIINVYALNGTDRPFFVRGANGKVAPRGDRHERKREFMRLLGEEIKRIRARPEGRDVVVIGDFNISRTKQDSVPRLRNHPPHVQARKEFNDNFILGLGLVDVIRKTFGYDAKIYTWFGGVKRGVDLGMDAARVDLILTTPELYKTRSTLTQSEQENGKQKKLERNRVVSCGVKMDEESMYGSDHAPMWVVVDF